MLLEFTVKFSFAPLLAEAVPTTPYCGARSQGFCFLFMCSSQFSLWSPPFSCWLLMSSPPVASSKHRCLFCLGKGFDCLFYSTWLRIKWVLGTSVNLCPPEFNFKTIYSLQVIKKWKLTTWCFRISGDLKGQRGRNCRIMMFDCSFIFRIWEEFD